MRVICHSCLPKKKEEEGTFCGSSGLLYLKWVRLRRCNAFACVFALAETPPPQRPLFAQDVLDYKFLQLIWFVPKGAHSTFVDNSALRIDQICSWACTGLEVAARTRAYRRVCGTIRGGTALLSIMLVMGSEVAPIRQRHTLACVYRYLQRRSGCAA